MVAVKEDVGVPELFFLDHGWSALAGPEKYRERGSTAPRKGPSSQEGRPHI